MQSGLGTGIGLRPLSVGMLNAAWTGIADNKQPDNAAMATARLDNLLGLGENLSVLSSMSYIAFQRFP